MKDRLLSLGDLFEVLPDGVVVVDETGRIVHANNAITSLLGYRSEDLVGQSLSLLVPERHRRIHEEQFRSFQQEGRPASMGSRPVLYGLHSSGKEIPLSISVSNLEVENGSVSVAIIRDAALVHDHLEAAITLAESDSLTGIANRLRLSRQIQTALSLQEPFALLFIDLTDFKTFNDRYGHNLGDEVLKLVARRLTAQVRRRDLAARLGGDEFVLFLNALSDPRDLTARTSEVLSSLKRPFEVGGFSGTIGANAGGAVHPRDGNTEEALLAVADSRMYESKKAERFPDEA